MFPYWILFGFFAAGAIAQHPHEAAARRGASLMLLIGALLTALMIGLRYEVGADWTAYELIFRFAGRENLGEVLALGDPGYQFLNWLVRQLGVGIWLVNLISGLIFAWGLVKFANTQRSPWLALLVAVPYLVIVVAMGYTRQGLAIGVLMAGLGSRLQGASMLRFAAYIAVAALFHKTAVVAFPLVAFAAERGKLMNFLIALAATVLLYDVFLAESVDVFVRNYIETAYASEGAAIRVVMSVIPALLFLLNQRRFRFREGERQMWRNFSLAALLLLVLLFVFPSSTAVDRVALYVIPLQLAVLSTAPTVFTSWRLGTVLVILYSLAVQLTWLTMARHARYWVPYQVYPF